MKRRFLVFFILVVAVAAALIAPYAVAEVNTRLYGSETEDLYELTGIIDSDNYQKVLRFGKDYSKVLYITSDSISECEFKKENNEWTLAQWRCVASKSGSADGFVYPYYPMKRTV